MKLVSETSRIYAEFSQPFNAALFDLIEFRQRFFDIPSLLSQLTAFFLDALHHQMNLSKLAGGRLVHLDDFLNLGDRETQALAAENLFEQVAVGGAEQTCAPATHGMN